jgi:hypothetical protein
VKGGKAGRGRKSSSARAKGKGPARGGAKKGAAKRSGSSPVGKKEKRTTRLGAVRLPDDA